MKTLKDYIKENNIASPINSIGCGGISAPSDSLNGSGDIPKQLKYKKVNKKSKKRNFK